MQNAIEKSPRRRERNPSGEDGKGDTFEWVGISKTAARIQTAQRQPSEYQEWRMPFGLGDGLGLTAAYAAMEPQAILKVH